MDDLKKKKMEVITMWFKNKFEKAEENGFLRIIEIVDTLERSIKALEDLSKIVPEIDVTISNGRLFVLASDKVIEYLNKNKIKYIFVH